MKKKAKQAARLPKRVPRAKQVPPGKIGVSAEPASPSSAWLDLLAKVDAEKKAPTLPLETRREPPPWEPPEESPRGRGYEPAGESPAPSVVVEMVGNVCQGCLETIETPKSHTWWCPWWDTPEGRAISPF